MKENVPGFSCWLHMICNCNIFGPDIILPFPTEKRNNSTQNYKFRIAIRSAIERIRILIRLETFTSWFFCLWKNLKLSQLNLTFNNYDWFFFDSTLQKSNRWYTYVNLGICNMHCFFYMNTIKEKQWNIPYSYQTG